MSEVLPRTAVNMPARLEQACSADWWDVRASAQNGTLSALIATRVAVERYATCINGRSLLHVAVTWGDEAAVRLLLARGADVNARDEKGLTPVHHAVCLDNANIVALLLAADCNVHARDCYGQTPLQRALAVFWIPGQSDLCCSPHEIAVSVLVRNGVRLRTLDRTMASGLPLWLQALEMARVSCRATIVALLGLKRRRIAALAKWDRFLVREVAVATWVTRSEQHWLPSE